MWVFAVEVVEAVGAAAGAPSLMISLKSLHLALDSLASVASAVLMGGSTASLMLKVHQVRHEYPVLAIQRLVV